MKLNFLIATVVLAFFTSGPIVQAVNLNQGKIPSPPPAGICVNSLKQGFVASDGTQDPNKAGKKVCVSTNIGQLPSVDKMTSCLITNPKNGQRIRRNQPFNVDIKVNNLATGFFSDPNVDYYDQAQTLDNNGVVQGHSHVTIQKIDGFNPPDAKVIAFFKGLNDPAKNGVLTQLVENGLPDKGQYRICTMNSANTHQCVVMPVAQRGAQDDCIRVNVV